MEFIFLFEAKRVHDKFVVYALEIITIYSSSFKFLVCAAIRRNAKSIISPAIYSLTFLIVSLVARQCEYYFRCANMWPRKWYMLPFMRCSFKLQPNRSYNAKQQKLFPKIIQWQIRWRQNPCRSCVVNGNERKRQRAKNEIRTDRT